MQLEYMGPAAFFVRILNRDNSKPFEESEVLAEILRPVCAKADLTLVDARDFGVGRISVQVLEAIREADIVFVDANEPNENVWYEFGYAHSIDPLKVIYLFRKGKHIPFDVSDFRGYEYDDFTPSSRAALQKKLEKALEQSLVQSTLNRLLLDDDWTPEMKDYFGSHKKMKGQAAAHLRAVALDIRRPSSIRLRAVKTLFEHHKVDEDLCERLVSPTVEESIRVAFLQGLQDLDVELPPSFWNRALQDERHPILREVAAAAALHWMRGTLDWSYFVDRIVHHEKWIARKHALMRMLDHFSDKVVDLVLELSQDPKEEIYNRVIEWFDKLIERDSPLSAAERRALEGISERWKDAKDEVRRLKLEEINFLLNKSAE